MQDMLEWADFRGYDWVISMDCDEQHEPASLPDVRRGGFVRGDARHRVEARATWMSRFRAIRHPKTVGASTRSSRAN
jgi:hypothetical protein